MRKNFADGHVVRAREVGKKFADFIVERKFALFLQQQDAGGGELLADRADAVTHRRRGGSFGREPRVSVGVEVGDLAVFHDCDGGAGDAGFRERGRGELIDFLLHIGGELGLGVRVQRSGGASQEQNRQT